MWERNRTLTERGRVEIALAFAVNASGLPEAVFKLRKRRSIKAKQERRYRCYPRYDRIMRPEVLAAAWDQVAANDGAPVVDGVRIPELENAPGVVERFLEDLHDPLKRKRSRPQAVQLKRIPKATGGQRPLGLPPVRDWAAKRVLEPIFEADLVPVSFGFRPGRSAHDALDAVQEGVRDGLNSVYDADLKGDFDTIPHHKLMACVAWRIADGAVLKLIRQRLRAPLMEEPNRLAADATVFATPSE